MTRIDGVLYYYSLENRCFVDAANNIVYNGNDESLLSLTNAINKIASGKNGGELIGNLADNDKNVFVLLTNNDKNTESENKNSRYTSRVQWNWKRRSSYDSSPGYIALTHELAHSWDRINGTMNNDIWFTTLNDKGEIQDVKKAEIYAIHIENLVRIENGERIRTHYQLINGYEPNFGRVTQGDRSLYFDKSNNPTLIPLSNPMNGYFYRR